MVPQAGQRVRPAGDPAQLPGDRHVRTLAADALGIEVPCPVAEPPFPRFVLDHAAQCEQHQVERLALVCHPRPRVQQLVHGPVGRERQPQFRQCVQLIFKTHVRDRTHHFGQCPRALHGRLQARGGAASGCVLVPVGGTARSDSRKMISGRLRSLAVSRPWIVLDLVGASAVLRDLLGMPEPGHLLTEGQSWPGGFRPRTRRATASGVGGRRRRRAGRRSGRW